jgi:hypothetical protein
MMTLRILFRIKGAIPQRNLTIFSHALCPMTHKTCAKKGKGGVVVAK